MHVDHSGDHRPGDPCFESLRGGAAAPARDREQDRHGDENQRVDGSNQKPCCGGRESKPIGPALLGYRTPVEQHGRRPERHGEDRRPEFRRRHTEGEDPDHQQDRHDRMRRTDHRAAEGKDTVKGSNHAHLRQQIDAEHPGRAECKIGEPVGERRADIRTQRPVVRDRKQVREIAGRRRIQQRRHRYPQRRLCEDGQPEDQPRTRAQRFDIEGDVKHRAPDEKSFGYQ